MTGSSTPVGGSPEEFRRWLEDVLASHGPGRRLPTDSELARRWGISARTVRRVMGTLSRSCRIVRVRGRGTFIAGRAVALEQEVAEPATSAENLADRLTAMIRSGDLKSGDTLPSVKFISLQFGLAPSTVLKAYRILAGEGTVERVGRRYRVGTFRRMLRWGGMREIALYLFADTDFSTLYHRGFMASAYRKMERELLKFGFCLRYHSGSDLQEHLRGWVSRRRFPHGLAFTNVTRKVYRGLVPTLHRLERYARQYAFSVLVAGEPYEGLGRRFSYLNRGTVGTSMSRTLAEYLGESGYDETVLFFDAERKSSRSFAAHLKTVRELGERHAGVPVTVVVRLEDTAAGNRGAFVQRAFRGAAEGRQASVAEASRALGGSLAHTIAFVDDFTGQFRDHCRNAVWVFAQDIHAAGALSWARTHRVKVPDQVGIIASENDPRYLTMGMSTCISDWETIGYLMAHSLIGDFPPEKTTHGFLRTPALMLRRLTTR